MGIAEKKNFSKNSLTYGFFNLLVFGLLLFPFSAASQTAEQLEKYPQILQLGTVEEKRTALSDLRNFESEKASRIAADALTDFSEVVVATALGAIVYIPADEASRLAVPFLAHRSPFIRREAALSLAKIGSTSVSTELVKTFETDRSKEVRAAAAHALGFAGDETSIGALVKLLKKKPKSSEEYLRRSSARAIGQIAERIGGLDQSGTTPESFLPGSYKIAAGNDSLNNTFSGAVSVLKTVLSNPKEANDTKREAAFALGAVGDKTSLPVLNSCSNNVDYYLAETCKEAVIRLS